MKHAKSEPTALDVTEWLLAWDRAGRPQPKWTVFGRLFQARMWREYAMTWHARKAFGRYGNDWVIGIGKYSYQECKRRARVNIYLARRLNRQSSNTAKGVA